MPSQVVAGAFGKYYFDDIPDVLSPTVFYFYLDHLDVVEEALTDTKADRVLQFIETWPFVPASLLQSLLRFGLTGHKQSRNQARALLRASDLSTLLITHLSEKDKAVRYAAADWIGQRRILPAEEALRAALKNEKTNEGKAAMLSALSRIGADISGAFDVKALKAEAEKGLAKTPAKSLEWFPFTALPSLNWRDGKPVDPIVVKWWIVLADKLKDPSGNALFELYLDRLKTEDAERFGLFLLQAFIERDTTTCSEQEALAAAKQSANHQQQLWQRWQQRNPMHAGQHPFSYEQAFAAAKAAKLREHIHSCSENKGLLGLTMRAPGPEAAQMVSRYLKDHGNKVNQSKALLQALARNPAPAAIQAVLAAANRLKQKTTQALARELVDAIAEEGGWTSNELADRTIPDAGFDGCRALELDCGNRGLFKALYKGDGRIDLVNDEGKRVKALPEAKAEADKELVAAAKKALGAARKEVKQVEAMQRARLYEAMCVERTWACVTRSLCQQVKADSGAHQDRAQ